MFSLAKYVTFIFGLQLMVVVYGSKQDGCRPADPNCHPSCVVYTAEHCRLCRCATGSTSGLQAGSGSTSGLQSGSGSNYDAGMSTDASWNEATGGGSSWSANVNKNAWSDKGTAFSGGNSFNVGGGGSGNSFNGGSGGGSFGNVGGGSFGSGGGSSDGGGDETIRYIIVEKEPDRTFPEQSFALPSSNILPGALPRGPITSPFLGHVMPSMPPGLGPLIGGSQTDVDTSYPAGSVVHIPLMAPGIPRYCVRCPILNCPGTCERTDSYGCRSCPCAPSRFQTMPVLRNCSEKKPSHQTRECVSTKLCISTCPDSYHLGNARSDGCPTCTCIRVEHAKPTVAPHDGCPATLSCMLKCTDGYLLGETQANGCPSCKCLPKGGALAASSSHANSNGGGNGNSKPNSNGDTWNSGTGTGTGNSNSWTGTGNGFTGTGTGNKYTGSGTGSGNIGTGSGYTGTGMGSGNTNSWSSSGNGGNGVLHSVNGIGKGNCKPPMCMDSGMSVDQAMTMGKESAGSGVMDGGSTPGMTSGGSTSGGNSNCYPMCSGGSNNQYSGGTGGMKSGGSGTSGSGCSGPFCASGSGMGGGMGGGMGEGGGGGSGRPFSPFAAAMSGGRDMGMTSTSGRGMGMTSTGGRGMGMTSTSGRGMGMTSTGGANDMSTAVSSAAYNEDCLGPACSVKNGMRNIDCPDLRHCLVTCDGRYLLGGLDSAGCQRCSCT